MTEKFIDSNKINNLKGLVDSTKLPLTLCVVNKNQKSIDLKIEYNNSQFNELIGSSDCKGLKFDFAISESTENESRGYFNLLRGIKNSTIETAFLRIVNYQTHKKVPIKITISPLLFINDNNVNYYVCTYEKINFDNIDENLIEEFLANSNDAIVGAELKNEKASNYARLERMFNDEKFLRKISVLARTSFVIEDSAAKISKMLKEYLKCDRVVIHDWNENSKSYSFVVSSNVEEDAEFLNKEDINSYIHFTKNLCESKRIEESRNVAVVIDNVALNEKCEDNKDALSNLSIKSQIVMDCIFDHTINGTIYIQQSTSRKWGRAEIAIVEKLAKQLSIMIERHKIVKELKISNNNLVKKTVELEASLVKEKEIREIQRDFVAVVSHQFRTPVQIIDGARNVLERKADKRGSLEEEKKFFDKIRNACNRISSLITKTIALATIDSGTKLSFFPETFNVKTFLQNIINAVAIKKEMEFIINLDGAPEEFYGDIQMLDHAIGNIIENAIKYSDKDNKIVINGRSENNNFVIEVRDFGIGIPQSQIDKIFTKFFRCDNTLEVSGSGIGLYLVKNFIENYHKGKIKVVSELGKGTSFFITLPILKEDNEHDY